ncbi:hypothetical protein J1614_004566 [Plenodomus biglobosus]|nr:hypothetical protein J1614_004566 [Plenodomus biglobosus]
MPYHCGLCDDSFSTKADLKHHTANHPDTKLPILHCPVCKWPFDDQLALEAHQRSSEHPNPLGNTGNAAETTCDRCLSDFTSQKEYNKHRSWPSGSCADFKQKKTPLKKQAQPPIYADHDKPALATEDAAHAALNYDDLTTVASDAANKSYAEAKCHVCQKVFKSLAQYNNHFLGCRPAFGYKTTTTSATPTNPSEPLPATIEGQPYHALEVQVPTPVAQNTIGQAPPLMQSVTIKTKPPVQRQTPTIPIAVQPRSKVQNPVHPDVTAMPGTSIFVCQRPDCGKYFKSVPALKVHHEDVHGIGGKKLDLHGRDSWMLGQRERERLRAEGLLKASPEPRHGRGGRRNLPVARSVTAQHNVATRALTPVRPVQHQPRMSRPGSNMPTGKNAGGPAEMEQAKCVQGKIMRLLIQSDIYITNYGELKVCGMDWIRIRTSVQRDLVDIIESMVHLPKMLQDEYVPFPKAFSTEYKYAYRPGDFEMSPIPNHTQPGLGAVALACSKVVLADGAQDVVKIAAVDFITGRILMNHLVCTSPNAAVKDWRTSSTGLVAWRDMECARSHGFKIFKGWSAVRSALHKFIDKDTILIGHNLRSDLDALRMIHGRAIDVVKVYEKAANGPLAKSQLGLDSLSKQIFGAELQDDPEYGRDVLMNAFAVREIVLCARKDPEALKRYARQTSLDLQRAGLTG